jgi:hypothetical protein
MSVVLSVAALTIRARAVDDDVLALLPLRAGMVLLRVLPS